LISKVSKVKQIKKLQNAPRDEEKLERLLKIKVKLAKDPADMQLIIQTRR